MKKQWFLVILCLALALVACGCQEENATQGSSSSVVINGGNDTPSESPSSSAGNLCAHEIWKDATCEAPKTCAACGETEGTALGHSWDDATCEAPKTCGTCNVTEGTALGHAWQEATCETPKTCGTCNATEGTALGHSWEEATTEAPKTCSGCGLTEGTKIETDSRFTTAATKDLHGVWVAEVVMTDEELGMPGLGESMIFSVTMELCNDGTAKMQMQMPNEETFCEAMVSYMVEMMYADLEEQGISREDGDAIFESIYGMGIEPMVRELVDSMFSELEKEYAYTGVYYVADGQIFMAESWDEELTPKDFTLSGDTLVLIDEVPDSTITSMTFTRVSGN